MAEAKTDVQKFLELIRERRGGRLKVYIGMMAGVGKTYRMLQEAHQLLQAGVDVRIGIIDPHGREETEALLDGVPVISLRETFYRGKLYREMDMECVLRERPEVVLVDELAHTNVPGSRNTRRYQDVLELLNNGINVITAFNVQHLESMVDRVNRVAGIEVRDTIPDRFLERADEVVNIDLPAADLIQRLQEGKIYPDAQIEPALETLFAPDKILQLRDLALRQVARLVEQRIEKSIPGDDRMPIEKFMACIGTDHERAHKILRKTARMASYYQSDWFVLHVKTSRQHTDRMEAAWEQLLEANLKWAQELGATVLRETDDDVPGAIYRMVKEHHVNSLVLGRPRFSLWRQLAGRNYVDAILRRLGEEEMDLILVS